KNPLTAPEMLAAAEQTRAIADRWRAMQFAPATPTAIAGATEALTTVADAAKRIADLAHALNRPELRQLSPAELEALLIALRDDAATARRIPPLRKVESTLAACGLAAFTTELRKLHPPADQWPAALDRAWLLSCLE